MQKTYVITYTLLMYGNTTGCTLINVLMFFSNIDNFFSHSCALFKCVLFCKKLIKINRIYYGHAKYSVLKKNNTQLIHDDHSKII